MANYLRPRRGQKSTAESQAVVLKEGEVFFEIGNAGTPTTGSNAVAFGKIKMGDGSTTYSNLGYFIDVDTTQVDWDNTGYSSATSADQGEDLYGNLNAISPTATIKSIFGNIKALLYKLATKVTTLNTKVTPLDAKITSLDNNVTSLDNKVTSLDTEVDEISTKVINIKTKYMHYISISLLFEDSTDGRFIDVTIPIINDTPTIMNKNQILEYLDSYGRDIKTIYGIYLSEYNGYVGTFDRVVNLYYGYYEGSEDKRLVFTRQERDELDYLPTNQYIRIEDRSVIQIIQNN